MSEIYLSLDLEMNQPSGKIIQIGAVVGNLRTGQILDTFNEYISIDERLNPFIVQLTGISEQTLSEKGIRLSDAYAKLVELHKKHNCFINPITWGGGDSQELHKQLLLEVNSVEGWPFGRRWIDIKTIYQFCRFAQGEKLQSGLSKSMGRMGLQFHGTKHNALDDAKNTFLFAHRILNLFKNINYNET